MKERKQITDKILSWRTCLKEAMIRGDIPYAMHCDKKIVELKKELDKTMGYKTLFYYETYDGVRHHFLTRFCYRPGATKAWRQLKKMLSEKKDNIRCIGYAIGDDSVRTIKCKENLDN